MIGSITMETASVLLSEIAHLVDPEKAFDRSWDEAQRMTARGARCGAARGVSDPMRAQCSGREDCGCRWHDPDAALDAQRDREASDADTWWDEANERRNEDR